MFKPIQEHTKNDYFYPIAKMRVKLFQDEFKSMSITLYSPQKNHPNQQSNYFFSTYFVMQKIARFLMGQMTSQEAYDSLENMFAPYANNERIKTTVERYRTFLTHPTFLANKDEYITYIKNDEDVESLATGIDTLSTEKHLLF